MISDSSSAMEQQDFGLEQFPETGQGEVFLAFDPERKFVVQATIPSGFHATMFDLSSDGQLSKLAQLRNNDTDRVLTYPSEGGSAQLTGDAGTDFVFVCIDRNKPLDVSDIQDTGVFTKLPSAQPHAVFKITTDGVQLIRASDSPSEKAKGIAPSTDTTGNLGSVQDQLNNTPIAGASEDRQLSGNRFFPRGGGVTSAACQCLRFAVDRFWFAP